MTKTDTGEKGLERLICTALTGAPCEPDMVQADEALVPKLPDRLTDKQKQRKAHNLLQELRRSGSITNLGTRSHPEWVIVEPPRD